MVDDKEIKIVFEPGCFDSFDGTQEELDELMAKITEMIESGEIFEQAEVMFEEDIPEWIAERLSGEYDDGEDRKRRLN